ncbi:MAG: amidohydrolase family protein [Bdellovibrionia bacterium]
MKSVTVDFHVHAFFRRSPARVPQLEAAAGVSQKKSLRRRARAWLKPWVRSAHQVQTVLRHLPEPLRKGLDQLASLVPLAHLGFESTLGDLQEAMLEAEVDYSVLIAHPPFIQNEFVLAASQQNPRLIAAVNIPKTAARPAQLLKQFHQNGARLLKIHAASDGEGIRSPRYKSLLRMAQDLGMPVILHTGCLHSRLLYRNPELCSAEKFKPWFQTYSKTQFILAHMNFHEPTQALDLGEAFENVWVDTSWQPTEVIGEAVRRMGPNRVLFASDWPLLGNNMAVGKRRVLEAVSTGLLNPEQAQLILGRNAIKLLGMSGDAS